MVQLNRKIKEHFNNLAQERDYWKKKNWYYYDYIENRLLPFLVPAGKKVLEIGCGTGDLLASLNPSLGHGLDISEEMIRLAKTKHNQPNLKFSVDGIENIEQEFDYIVISDVVGYLEDIEEDITANSSFC